MSVSTGIQAAIERYLKEHGTYSLTELEARKVNPLPRRIGYLLLRILYGRHLGASGLAHSRGESPVKTLITLNSLAYASAPLYLRGHRICWSV